MLKVDLHIHTIASSHAHNTILEYINRAKKMKMNVIGISEHGPGAKNAILDRLYFTEICRIPKIVEGIRILKGVEANIINTKGKLDLDEETLKKLDYVMANIHSNTVYRDKGLKINTQTIVNTIKSGKINILTHPFAEKGISIDIRKISEEACKKDILLEIDMAYLSERRINKTIIANLKIMLDVVKQFNKKIIIGSDAHNIWELGDDSVLKRFKKEIGLTDDMIINNYPKELFKFLKIDG